MLSEDQNMLDLLKDPKSYEEILNDMDSAVCEAMSVGQYIGHQIAEPHIGYSTHIATRINCHAVSIMMCAPKSRWVKPAFEHWDFSAIAGHARSILEGYLFLVYISSKPQSEDEWRARLNVMHMNDCVRRLKLFKNGLGPQFEFYSEQKRIITERLEGNKYFQALPDGVRRGCLKGQYLMISTQDEMVERVGWDVNSFRVLWDVMSQYAHVLTLSFYNMEVNGRGTGLENEADRSYMTMSLALAAEAVSKSTDILMGFFPGALQVRRGIASQFSPGPYANDPKKRENAKPMKKNNNKHKR